jgi:hypothetical protein
MLLLVLLLVVPLLQVVPLLLQVVLLKLAPPSPTAQPSKHKFFI